MTSLPGQVYKAISSYIEKPNINLDFVGNKPTTPKKLQEQDNYLTSLGLIPNKIVKQIENELDEEHKNQIKYVIADITKNTMDINIEI